MFKKEKPKSKMNQTMKRIRIPSAVIGVGAAIAVIVVDRRKTKKS